MASLLPRRGERHRLRCRLARPQDPAGRRRASATPSAAPRTSSASATALNASLLGLPTDLRRQLQHHGQQHDRVRDCLVCRADEARDDMLRAASAPRRPICRPTPPARAPPTVARSRSPRASPRASPACRRSSAAASSATSRARRSTAPRCTPASSAVVQAKVNEAANRCTDSTGLLGCLFEGGTATCLGDAATAIGSTLVDVTFGQSATRRLLKRADLRRRSVDRCAASSASLALPRASHRPVSSRRVAASRIRRSGCANHCDAVCAGGANSPTFPA